LIGNPCASFEGYREYVLNELPQLAELDGHLITRTERILAAQGREAVAESIERQSAAEVKKEEERVAKLEARKQKKPGFDGSWYCDTQKAGGGGGPAEAKIVELGSGSESEPEDEAFDDPEKNDAYWKEEEEFTPETRFENAVRVRKQREAAEATKAGRPIKRKTHKRRCDARSAAVQCFEIV
jgi:protein TilB